jgi:hypothetical protein
LKKYRLFDNTLSFSLGLQNCEDFARKASEGQKKVIYFHASESIREAQEQ